MEIKFIGPASTIIRFYLDPLCKLKLQAVPNVLYKSINSVISIVSSGIKNKNNRKYVYFDKLNNIPLRSF